MTNTTVVELKKQFHVESARFLPRLPDSHPCKKMHGHSFKVTFAFRGAIDPELGWLIDYGQIDEIVRPVLRQIDHCVLNEVSGLENPTTEILCRWIYDKTKTHIPSLSQVIVSETHDTECQYPITVP